MTDYKLYDEEDELASVDALLKQALTSRLRSGGGGSAWGNAVRGVGDTLINSMDRGELERKKAALIQQKRLKMEEAMQALPEDLRGLAKLDPKGALAEVFKNRERERAMKDFQGRLGGESGGPEQLSGPGMGQPTGGGGALNFDQMDDNTLVRYMGHPNKDIAEEAKFYAERRMPKAGKTDELYRGRGGDYSALPGAVGHVGATEEAKSRAKGLYEPEWITDPNDPTKQVPTSRTALLGGGAGSRPSAPSSPLSMSSSAMIELDKAVMRDPKSDPRAKAAAAQRLDQAGVKFDTLSGQGLQGSALPMSTGPSRPSEQGKSLATNKAQEVPKLQTDYESLRNIGPALENLKRASPIAPSTITGTDPEGQLRLAYLRTREAMGSKEAAESLKAAQDIKNGVGQLMQLEARASGLGTGQGFTQTDKEFVERQFPGLNSTHVERMQSIKALEERFGPRLKSLEERLKAYDPTWVPSPRPTEPGTGSAPVPGKQSALPESYWSATAGGPGPSDAMPEGRSSDGGNILSRTLKGIEHGIGSAGVGMTQAMPKALVKALGMQYPEYQDVARIREQAPRSTAGKVGEFAGEVMADPTTYLPGGTALKALVSGLASGYMQPSASEEEGATSTLFSGALGPLSHAVSKFIPRTEVSSPAQAAARKGFEDIPLSQKQIAGQKATWEAEGIAKKQAEALTEKVMASTGSTSKRATTRALDDQEILLKGEYNRMFPSNKPMRMDTQDAMQLTATLDPYKGVLHSPDFMERAPGVTQLYDHARRTLDRGKARTIPADVVQSAIQDVSRVENPRMQLFLREEIKNFAKKNLTKDEVEALDKLNSQWGSLSDARRMTHKEGVFIPSSMHGAPGTEANEARKFIEQFDVQNPKLVRNMLQSHGMGTAGAVGASLLGVPFGAVMAVPFAKHVVDRGSGAAQGALGTSRVLNADPAVKDMIELLRKGVQLGPREAAEFGRE